MTINDPVFRGRIPYAAVQFRPPDDRPVKPETCRGKRIADIVRRQKTVYQVGNKENKLY